VTVARQLRWKAGEEFGGSNAGAAAPANHAVVESIPDGVGLATVFAVSVHGLPFFDESVWIKDMVLENCYIEPVCSKNRLCTISATLIIYRVLTCIQLKTLNGAVSYAITKRKLAAILIQCPG
jgi:hypothetical protein